MFFEPLENSSSITLILIFHLLCYSINLKKILDGLCKIGDKEGKESTGNLVKIVIQKDDCMIILSSVEFENTNNFIPS